jgi:hypothetical protein
MFSIKALQTKCRYVNKRELLIRRKTALHKKICTDCIRG